MALLWLRRTGSVVDPVLVSTSGDELAGPAILDALRYGIKLSFLGECVVRVDWWKPGFIVKSYTINLILV